jgi:hypothetical protein
MTSEDPLSELLDAKVVSEGLPGLLRVPDPDPNLKVVRVADVEKRTAQLLGLLGAVVNRAPQLTRTADAPGTDADNPEWAEAFRKVVAFVTWYLKDERVRSEFLSAPVDKPGLLSFASYIRSPEEVGLAETVKLERMLLWTFLLGLMMSQLSALTGRRFNSLSPVRPDETVLEMISSLASLAVLLDDPYSSAAAAMTACLSFAARHDARLGAKREIERQRTTAHTVLEVHELPLLASRAPHTLERYGEKEVETRFEQQLALALQTCGFRTIPAARGQRRGDLICLTDKVPPVAILVDAKTSARPYNLPAKDERALIEYAQWIDDASFFQYPLRLICIVGQQPGRNIADRLRRIESATQVPTHYCNVVALVRLLTHPPVGVTSGDIVEAIVGADAVVPVDGLASLSSAAAEKLAALRQSVEKFLS